MRKKSVSFLVALILAVTVAALADDAPESPGPMEAGPASGAYLVGGGDVLRIVVWKNEDLSGEYVVRPDGKTTLPLIGDVVALGLTTEEIATQIKGKLELFIEDPFITVILQEAASNKIYVMGEVSQPGTYPLLGRMTVIQALSLAGGFSTFAQPSKIGVIRFEGGKQVRYRVNYGEILKDPEGGNNLLLQRGDTVVVP